MSDMRNSSTTSLCSCELRVFAFSDVIPDIKQTFSSCVALKPNTHNGRQTHRLAKPKPTHKLETRGRLLVTHQHCRIRNRTLYFRTAPRRSCSDPLSSSHWLLLLTSFSRLPVHPVFLKRDLRANSHRCALLRISDYCYHAAFTRLNYQIYIGVYHIFIDPSHQQLIGFLRIPGSKSGCHTHTAFTWSSLPNLLSEID